MVVSYLRSAMHMTWKMEKLKVDAQENVMGRTKLESIELDDDVKPENAHVARTVVEDEEGEEMEILRHSYLMVTVEVIKVYSSLLTLKT